MKLQGKTTQFDGNTFPTKMLCLFIHFHTHLGIPKHPKTTDTQVFRAVGGFAFQRVVQEVVNHFGANQ